MRIPLALCASAPLEGPLVALGKGVWFIEYPEPFRVIDEAGTLFASGLRHEINRTTWVRASCKEKVPGEFNISAVKVS